MKNFLLFIICLWQLNQAGAQTNVYHPFPNDSVVWLSAHAPSWGDDTWVKTELLGDTLINTISYKKLYTSYNYYNPFFFSPLKYNGGIRQDIFNKKVYYIDTNAIESILYDFNLVIGDTIVKNIPSMNDVVFVSGIDSTLVGNNYHKTYVLSSTNQAMQPAKFIEGVGSDAGLRKFYYRGGFEYGSNDLHCFSVNSVRLYPNYGFQCPLTISIGFTDISQQKLEISISPNPTKDEISLTINCNDSFNIEIQNSMGQCIFNKNAIMFSESTIDLSGYDGGIYFVRISDSKGNFVVKKIVKE
ncbi:MAG: T9SS type A sorting domain-containing protein [Bacteroidota bacterium]